MNVIAALTLTTLGLIALVQANDVEYNLKCTQREVGIRWPSYHSNSQYFVCGHVGGRPLTITCSPGEVFTFVLQLCTSPSKYIPAPPLSVLPLSSPSINRPTMPLEISQPIINSALPLPLYPGSQPAVQGVQPPMLAEKPLTMAENPSAVAHNPSVLPQPPSLNFQPPMAGIPQFPTDFFRPIGDMKQSLTNNVEEQLQPQPPQKLDAAEQHPQPPVPPTPEPTPPVEPVKKQPPAPPTANKKKAPVAPSKKQPPMPPTAQKKTAPSPPSKKESPVAPKAAQKKAPRPPTKE